LAASDQKKWLERSKARVKTVIAALRRRAKRAARAATERQQAEEHSKGGEQDHAARSMIAMRPAEDHGEAEHA